MKMHTHRLGILALNFPLKCSRIQSFPHVKTQKTIERKYKLCIFSINCKDYVLCKTLWVRGTSLYR